VVHSAEEALKAAGDAEEIMVIGGQKIFEQFMQKADRIYLTIIDGIFEGDTYFPKLGRGWKEAKRERHKADENNPYDYDFVVFEK
jgi:dihydrofolate reductase